ncbi:hypothetical protein F5Y04DRAFT_259372 [Hypomontagnella monticulosa]|nr:hypothetical protein F5Y04DRAFT_259372 [Hypomontagnella monticulosa]
MTFRLYENKLQWAEFWIIILALVLAIVFTALRFAATRRGKRSLGLEDWMALAALAFFTMFSASCLLALLPCNGKDVYVLAAQDPEAFGTSRLWTLVSLFAFFCSYLTTKLSVLALYYRLFGVVKVYARWIYSLAVFEMVWFIIMCILQGCQCQPINRFWQPETAGKCINEGVIIVFSEVPNSTHDFAMMILAMFMLRPLQIDEITKWRLRILFGLGGLVGLLGIVKICISYSEDTIYPFAKFGILSFIQSFLAMFCCCAPVFHHILPGHGVLNRISSSLANIFQRSWWCSLPKRPPRNLSRQRITNRPPQDYGWEPLREESTQDLAFVEATYRRSVYAMKGPYSNERGIRIERFVSVVE